MEREKEVEDALGYACDYAAEFPSSHPLNILAAEVRRLQAIAKGTAYVVAMDKVRDLEEKLTLSETLLEQGRLKIEEQDREIEALRSDREREQMRLAACGVAAMSNTVDSIARHRIGPQNPYYSASYGDVCAAVDREMALRSENEALRKAVEKGHPGCRCGC